MEKECKSCNKILSYDFFYKKKETKDGLYYSCKKCHSKYVNSNAKPRFYDPVRTSEINKKRNRSYSGYKARLWNGITNRIKNCPSYRNIKLGVSRDDFIKWIDTTNFDVLYKNWCDSNYNYLYSPSVDRIDTYQGYYLENMQIITFIENVRKPQRKRTSHINKLSN